MECLQYLEDKTYSLEALHRFPSVKKCSSSTTLPFFRQHLLSVFFLADRNNGRAIATLLRLSSVVCDVMYCG